MLTETTRHTIDGVVASLKDLPGALLPLLHGVQDAVGHVPPEAVDGIARALNLSRAEVHGVITYYHHFRSEAPARQVVQMCRAEACQAMGSEALWEHARLRLACDEHGTSRDGVFSLEPVYCLGLCASSPALAINGTVHARVVPRKLDALLDQAAGQACV